MALGISGRFITLAFVGTLFGKLGAGVSASAPAAVYFPEGYRHRQIAKFKLIGPSHPNYATQAGFRRHFANDRALATWEKFRDGSVIVDEPVHAALDAQGTRQAGGLGHVAVMCKERKRYANTGGWYFNAFSARDTRSARRRRRPRRPASMPVTSRGKRATSCSATRRLEG